MLARPLVLIAVVVVVSALTGCRTTTVFNPAKLGGGDDPTMRTQLTAFAAKTENQYPEGAQASDELNVSAIVTRADGSLRLYNFTDQTLSEGKGWVNREFVTPLRAIAPNGKLIIGRNLFYNNTGTPLSGSTAGIVRVQIERQGTLYNVLGPALE